MNKTLAERLDKLREVLTKKETIRLYREIRDCNNNYPFDRERMENVFKKYERREVSRYGME